MHTNIQYMTCYMSLYKYILYNYLPFRLGYYCSKCKISRTGHYLGHSGVSIGRLMRSNNAAGRGDIMSRWLRGNHTSKHTEYEYFYVEFVLCIAGTTHQPRMDRSTWFRKTKTATADFVAWASKTQVHGRATEGADTACGPAPEKSGEIQSPWSSSEATDARLSD